jgi:hypothetical protein
MWRVTDAAGEPAGSVLRLTGQREGGFPLVLFRACGAVFGSWVGGTSGGFLAAASASSQGCPSVLLPDDLTPAWLATARSFATKGPDRVLLDANSRIVARLLPGGQHLHTAGIPTTETKAPTLTPAQLKVVGAPAKVLPTNAPPATTAKLTGTWRPSPLRQYPAPVQPAAAPDLRYKRPLGWVGRLQHTPRHLASRHRRRTADHESQCTCGGSTHRGVQRCSRADLAARSRTSLDQGHPAHLLRPGRQDSRPTYPIADFRA